MDPFANEAKELVRLFSMVTDPNEIRIREIAKLYPLCWKVDVHCSNVSEFENKMMKRL
jgi:hypothetical protein